MYVHGWEHRNPKRDGPVQRCGGNEEMKQVLENFEALVGYSPGILRMPLEFFKILATIMIVNIVVLVVIVLASHALKFLYTFFGAA
jgi:hypothetical protein